MTNALDVLLLESHPHAGDATAVELAAAGHTVHRCHEPGDPSYVCRGMSDPTACPLDRQRIDVAVLVRRPDAAAPTPLEDGARCALRAGVPLVTVGRAETPYDPWVALKAVEGIAASCDSAARLAWKPVASAVIEAVQPAIERSGAGSPTVECSVEPDGATLRVLVTVDGPVDRSLEQAVAVRAYEAIRHSGRGREKVEVSVQGTRELVGA